MKNTIVDKLGIKIVSHHQTELIAQCISWHMCGFKGCRMLTSVSCWVPGNPHEIWCHLGTLGVPPLHHCVTYIACECFRKICCSKTRASYHWENVFILKLAAIMFYGPSLVKFYSKKHDTVAQIYARRI